VFAGRDPTSETVVRIEVLYFEGCPGHTALIASLPELMIQACVDESIRLTAVESVADAHRERFLGSPTLRIDGQDVDPDASRRNDYGLKCRLYRTAAGLRGTVPDELVLAALTRAHDSPRADG